MNKKAVFSEKTGLRFSMVGALTLGITGVSFSFFTGSQSVLLDGLFNFIAAATVFFGIKTSELVLLSTTKKRPAGYAALEPFYMVVKGTINAGLNIYVVIANITILLSGGSQINLGIVIVYILIAITGSGLVFISLIIANKQSPSALLMAERDGWGVNLIISSGIGLSFLLVYLFQDGFLKPWIPYIDQIVVISIGVLTIGVPIKAIRMGASELLLLGHDESSQQLIDSVIGKSLRSFEVETWDAQFVKTGRRTWVTLFVVPKKEVILRDWPETICKSTRDQLAKHFPFMELDVIIKTTITHDV